LREELRLWVFENRVLRRIFGLRRNKITAEWKKLHSNELNDLYSLLKMVPVIKLRRMRWAGHVDCMGRGAVHAGFWGRVLEGNRSLERPRRRWEDDIKIDIQEVGCGSLDWIGLA